MTPLKYLDQFQTALKDYQPSPEAVRLLEQTPLVIMLGVSGGGRNTIINHLVNSGHYQFIVSDTTRPPKLRDGRMEVEGVNYYFRSEETVLDDIQHGRFLEAEIIHKQQVSGISIRELQQVANSGKIPINEVDLGGTQSIRATKPDTYFFFIVPPSYKEWIYRLKGREVMGDEEFANRCQTAIAVLKEGLRQPDFTFVVNDSSHHSAEEIDAQVRGHRLDKGSHQEGRRVAGQILSELEARLGTH